MQLQQAYLRLCLTNLQVSCQIKEQNFQTIGLLQIRQPQTRHQLTANTLLNTYYPSRWNLLRYELIQYALGELHPNGDGSSETSTRRNIMADMKTARLRQPCFEFPIAYGMTAHANFDGNRICSTSVDSSIPSALVTTRSVQHRFEIVTRRAKAFYAQRDILNLSGAGGPFKQYKNNATNAEPNKCR